MLRRSSISLLPILRSYSHSHLDDSVEAILTTHAKQISRLTGQITSEYDARQRQLKEWRTSIDPTLQKVLQCYSQNKYHPLVVGSAMTGLASASEGSDVDLVLYTSTNEDILERSRLSITSNTAHSEKVLKRAALFSRARHPIAKIQVTVPRVKSHQGGKKEAFLLELSVDSMVHARNSLFVHHSLQADKRVVMLYYWVKHWLRKCDLLGSQQGKFSSYHTILFVIHFLQYKNHMDMNPVLSLMIDQYDDDLNPNLPFSHVYKIASTSELAHKQKTKNPMNTMQIGELIVRFIDFYSRMNLHDFTLHIPSGTNIERTDDDYDHIQLVDPYSDGQSVCRVHQGVGQLSTAVELTRHAFSLGRGLSMPFSFTGRL
ncbi:hypothetical protein QR680_004105 [Steinernema hermaphroditum]|uniref:Poly(A) RNA polymerase mitochondrial-like central palm domain-containing protein n=1 Tax=Steinernema hermaphroditum TaxID=289476 RepID=A0AA39LTH1_9BILA|nr:hypothetical protein QR680_004105 [Steinernema hermaphroditum]